MGDFAGTTDVADRVMLPVVRLTKVGFKLAVLGVMDGATSAAEARWWHIMRPGSLGATDIATGHRYGRTMCGITAVSNGYSSDFTPPEKVFCPACKEQV